MTHPPSPPGPGRHSTHRPRNAHALAAPLSRAPRLAVALRLARVCAAARRWRPPPRGPHAPSPLRPRPRLRRQGTGAPATCAPSAGTRAESGRGASRVIRRSACRGAAAGGARAQRARLCARARAHARLRAVSRRLWHWCCVAARVTGRLSSMREAAWARQAALRPTDSPHASGPAVLLTVCAESVACFAVGLLERGQAHRRGVHTKGLAGPVCTDRSSALRTGCTALPWP